ncbi:MAG TPA: DUF1499 domain-containing protein [Candidatus Binataceae bacterium]|nr:DUF1499 domain-containing protein [Candidatus Binataceae bacterium]
MTSLPYFNLIVAVVVLLALIFVPFLRRLVFALLRIAIALAAAFIAIAGISMLMNNETIYEKPGAKARFIRFITEDHAATSEKGLGTATCKWPDEPTPVVTPSPGAAPTPAAASAAQSKPGAPPPGAAASPGEEDEDVYPELMTRSFPGISRQKLFDLSQQTANSLGGWKVVKADPRAGTLDCIYTSRIIGAEDDVRITVTPKGDIELCSRSGTARPGSTSILGFFPGDFGANIGHIKQFYETLEPKMDEVYKEAQEKENAKKPKGGQ